MTKKQEEFKYLSEEDYKTLITIYQQKVFELFNRNISLEAKVLTLNTLVESLNETVSEITKEKATRSTTKKSRNTSTRLPEIESFSDAEEEMFN